jgi:hypothetical protein
VDKHTDLISRLQDEADLCRNDGATDIAALLDEAVGALRAENAVLAEQVRALWHALAKVLDAGNREAAATMSWQNARENFGDSSHERKAHERAMLAASEAEREAHVLLATLKRIGA